MSLNFPISLTGKRGDTLDFGKASRSFDGSGDFIDFGDSDIFSFGDAVNDSAFSVSGWIKPVDVVRYRVLNKYSITDAEWIFGFDGAGHFIFYLQDGGFSQRRGIRMSTASTSLNNTWIHVVGTYDGRGGTNAHLGLKIYLNGQEVTNLENQISSGYTAMHNTTVPLQTGNLVGFTDYSHGLTCDLRLYDKELSSAEVSNLYTGINVSDSLVGWWLKNTDDLIDHSINNNDGDNNGTPTYSTTGPLPSNNIYGKNSQLFDGSYDYIDIGNNYGTDTSFTACAWVRRAAVSGPQSEGIVGKWSNGGFRSWLLYSGNEFRFIIRQTDGTLITLIGPTSTVIGQWYHVACTSDGSNIKLYVDGSLAISGTFDGTMESGPTPATIGVYNEETSYNHRLDGNICDVRIYNSDIGVTEIANLAAGTDYQTDLVGWWLRNTDDFLDYSGSGNHGTGGGSEYSIEGPLT